MPELEIDGNGIYWELVGRGEPVALLNGVLMTTQSWTLQTSVLRRHHRCLLHDFRGQLLSGRPLRPWSLRDHVRDLEALLDHLEIERVHLVGTSYGGEVGLLFAASLPQRVRSLTVISSVSEVGPEVDRIVCDWRRAALERPEALYQVMLPTTFSRSFRDANPKLIEQGAERLRQCDADFFRAFARLIDAFRQLDITSDLNAIRCPALVMVGEEDALKPLFYSRLIADRIADAELVVIPSAGHAVVLERPDAVNATLLAFLNRQSGSRASETGSRRDV